MFKVKLGLFSDRKSFISLMRENWTWDRADGWNSWRTV